MADTDKLADGDRRFVARLLADTPKLAGATELAKRLNRLPRKKGSDSFQDVLAAAADTLLAGFAAGLGRDQAAVQAILDLFPRPRAPSRAK